MINRHAKLPRCLLHVKSQRKSTAGSCRAARGQLAAQCCRPLPSLEHSMDGLHNLEGFLVPSILLQRDDTPCNTPGLGRNEPNVSICSALSRVVPSLTTSFRH
jgi:hypothetical protein